MTPVENFYQRILAGDPDEARDHAEKLLKDRSLIAYYDDVALKGLQLAANDAQRGVLGDEKLATMRASVRELLGDLARHRDQQPEPPARRGNADVPTIAEQELPAPEIVPAALDPATLAPAWRGKGAVLCIAGRGPLDEAAAGILAQLLTKHGLGARVLPHSAVSRADIEGLDLDGVAMVCIAYLEVQGSPSHLRYLLQRLRERLPTQKLLIGLWPDGETVFADETIRREIGADLYVSTLKEAVESCIGEARAAAPAAA